MLHTHQRDKPDVPIEPGTSQHTNPLAYFVGSGIASLAGAAFLIRDGLVPGESIHVYRAVLRNPR